MLQLTAVQLVLRHKFSKSSSVPTEVASTLTDLIVDDMPLSRACELTPVGSFEPVDFMWSRGLRALNSNGWTVGQLVHSEPHYYRNEYSQALSQAIKRGDLSMTSWLCDHFSGCRVTKDVVNEAARGGHLGMLQILDNDRENAGVEFSSSSVEKAAEGGHWDLVRWLDKRSNTPQTRFEDEYTLGYAIKQNKFEQVKWAMAMGFSGGDCPSPKLLSIAEWQLQSQIIRYLVEKGRRECAWGALMTAVVMGDLSFVQWIASTCYLKDGQDSDTQRTFIVALNFASEYNRLSVVQWLLTCTDDLLVPHGPAVAILEAAKGGSLSVVQWLYNRYRSDPGFHLFRDEYKCTDWYSMKEKLAPISAMDLAACNGHLDVLQFLHRIEHNRSKKNPSERLRGLSCTLVAMDGAAAAGHYDVVKWLHPNRSEGCTTRAMDKVAEGNLHVSPGRYRRDLSSDDHLEFLQWLYSNRLSILVGG